MFDGEPFAALKRRGARVQRPFWASTGTKNASYSDVLYLEALIGPDTITTVPPATLDAFRDHGRVRVTLGTEEEEAEAVLATAAALGLDVHAITEQLQADGIKAFASSFDQLLATLRRSDARSSRPRADVTPLVVFTIGHSTRAIEDFIRLLKAHGVQRVIDVRTIPRSRHNPQFNRGQLSPALHRARMHYTHMPGLGGLRRARRDSLEHGVAECQLPRLCRLHADLSVRREPEPVHCARQARTSRADVR